MAEPRKVAAEDAPGFGRNLVVRELDAPGTCADCGPSSGCGRVRVSVLGGPDDGHEYWVGACHLEKG